MGIFTKIFGTYSDRQIKKIIPIVDKIEALEEEISKLTDAEMKAKTDEFKNRFGRELIGTNLGQFQGNFTLTWEI